jgi:hypothetical protein
MIDEPRKRNAALQQTEFCLKTGDRGKASIWHIATAPKAKRNNSLQDLPNLAGRQIRTGVK